MRLKNIRKMGLLFFLLLFVLQATVTAQEQKGSVTLQVSREGAGTQITLYPVADYDGSNYIFNSDFADCGLVIEDLGTASKAQEAAKELASYAAERQAAGIEGSIGDEGSLTFGDLTPALYLAVQTGGPDVLQIAPCLIPIPYSSQSGEGWVYDAVVSPKYSFPGGAVIATKVDEEGNVVGQAHFTLQQRVPLPEGETAPAGAQILEDEKGSFYWMEFEADLVSGEQGQIVLTDMPLGEYRLVETQAPEGFVSEEVIQEFSITKAGQVQELKGVYTEKSGQVEKLTVVNRQIRAKVNKVDAQGNPVEGAKLVVKRADGQVIRTEDGQAQFTFISTKEPYELKRIPAGDYLLSEVDAPEGYKVSKDVPFTVQDGADSVNEVVMVDEKEEKTPARLKVTKSLVDEEGLPLAAKDASFYVALFGDEELTRRVSGVKELHYKGTSRESVIFENLIPNQAYYVSETDEFGEPLVGRQEGNGVYMPEYPEDISITPTQAEPEPEFAFLNRYMEIPGGFYYVGELTVTKKVLRGTEAYNTDQVFYAGVFKDKEYTEMEGDVLTLEMNGGSETSVTVEVGIGEDPDSVMTYYVAETDENGNVLRADAGLEFVVSVDKTEVTMSTQDIKQEVVITNTFRELTPTPEVTATVTPVEEATATPPGSSTNVPQDHSGSGTASVKTGDDTPVGAYVICAVAAAALLGAAAVLLYKRKKKS